MTEKPDHKFDELPPSIIEALREMDGPTVMPDAQRDADVISGARRHLMQDQANETEDYAPSEVEPLPIAQSPDEEAQRQRNLRRFFAGAVGSAVAAAAVIAIVVFVNGPDAGDTGSPSPGGLAEDQDTDNTPPQTVLLARDHNGTGDVNTLDARTLELLIADGNAPDDADHNNDGFVDSFDAQIIAIDSVTINRERVTDANRINNVGFTGDTRETNDVIPMRAATEEGGSS